MFTGMCLSTAGCKVLGGGCMVLGGHGPRGYGTRGCMVQGVHGPRGWYMVLGGGACLFLAGAGNVQ